MDPEVEAIHTTFGVTGEAAARAQRTDWAQTPLGPVRQWPAAMRTAVRLAMDSPQPVTLYLGDQMVIVQNDAVLAVNDQRAREASGHAAIAAYPELREYFEQMAANVRTGEAAQEPTVLIPRGIDGRMIDFWYHTAAAPIRDNGAIIGIYQVWLERTQEVLTARRLHVVNALSAQPVSRSRHNAIEQSVGILRNAPDVLFAAGYLVDRKGQRADLVAVAGVDAGGAMAPEALTSGGPAVWPFERALREGRAIELDDLPQRVPEHRIGPAGVQPERAIIYPIRDDAQSRVVALLVLGVNPRLIFDDRYRAFLQLVGETIAARSGDAERRESEERQAFLLKFSDALRPLDAAAEIQGEATRLLREHLDAGWCYYVEWNEAAAQGVVLRDATRDGLPSLAGTHDVSDVPAFLDILRKGTVLNVSDYTSFEGLSWELRARYTALGFRSMLVATLVKQGRLVASLIVGDTDVRDWSGDSEALLTEVAERTWAAVERARAEAALRESKERQAFLVRFSDAVRGLTDPMEVATTACRMLLEQLDVDRAHWSEVDWATEEFVTMGSVHSPGVAAIEGRFPLAAWEPYSASHLEGRAVIVDDTQTDPRTDSAMRAATARMEIGADLAAPVLVGGRLASVLAVKQRQPRRWRSEEIALVEGVAGRCWAEVGRARAEAALRASEAKYRTLFESMGQGYATIEMIHGPDGRPIDHRLIDLNPAFERLTGIRLTDAIGRTATAVTPGTDPWWFETYDRIAHQGYPERVEYELTALGRWYEAHCFPQGGERLTVLYDDITERKCAEQRQAFLVKAADALQSLTDAAQIEETTCRLLGEHLRVDRAYYVDIDERAGIATVSRQYLREGAQSSIGVHPLEAFGWSLPTMRRSEMIVVDDIRRSQLVPPADVAAMEAVQQAAIVAAPIVRGDALVAVLCVTDTVPRTWKPDEVDLVREVMQRTWAAVERARAEAALRKSEEKYRTLFETVEEGFAIIELVRDARGNFVDLIYREVNRSFARHMGMPVVAGQRISELLPNLDRDRLDVYGRVGDTGEPFREEYHSVDLDRWYTVRASCLGQSGSSLIAVVFEDITERKLREQQKDYLLKLSDALRPLADPAQIKVEAARVLGEQLGVNRALYAEVVGENWWAERGYVRDVDPLPTGAYSSDTYGRWIMQTYRRGESLVFEDVRADSRFTQQQRAAAENASIIGAVAVPLVKRGDLVALLSVHTAQPHTWTAHEIAIVEETAERTWAAVERAKAEEALRASEEKYRTLFDSIDEGLTVTELVRDSGGTPIDLIYRECNQAFERLSGLPREVMNKRVTEVFPHFDPEWFVQYARIAETGVPERSEEYIPDLGRYIHRFMSRIGGAGSPFCAVVFDDITERKLREQRQEFLLKFSDALRAEGDADAVARRAIEMLSAQLNLDRCYITFYRPDNDEASFPYQVGNNSVPPLPDTVRLSDFSEAYEQVRGKTFVIDDDFEREGLSEAEKANSKALGMRAMVASTARKGEKTPISSLVAVSARPRRWSAGEIALVEEAAERTWAAMERAKAENALRASEEKFRTLFETIDEGFVLAEVIYDDQGRAVDALYVEGNPAASRLTGGRDYNGTLFSDLVPDREDSWVEIYDRVARTGHPERLEQFLTALERWYNFHVSRVSSDASVHNGGPRVAVVFQDVTDRKRAEDALRASEERLRGVLESMREGFAHFGSDFTILDVNEETLRLDGRSRGELVGRSHWDAFPGTEHSPLGDLYRRVMRERVPGSLEHRYQWPDGHDMWVDVRAYPTDDGGMACFWRDVTERKHASDALRESQERLRTLNEQLEERVRERTAEVRALFQRLVSAQEEERRRIARDIHDQVGQQMTALRMNLETLRSQAAGRTPLTEQAERTQRLAEELDQSIDFLTWQLRPAALDHLGLSAALQNLVTGWSERFGVAADLAVDAVEDVRLPRDVEANLYRIAQEALHNVAKHADATQVTVYLAQQDGHLVLLIEDNGRGFDARRTQSPDNGGNSMGLMSMQERAALVGGQLHIESLADHGTSIYVRIPQSEQRA